MNKIFNVLFSGMLILGVMTANAEPQIFKKKKKKRAETEQADSIKKDNVSDYKKLLKGAKTIEGM